MLQLKRCGLESNFAFEQLAFNFLVCQVNLYVDRKAFIPKWFKKRLGLFWFWQQRFDSVIYGT